MIRLHPFRLRMYAFGMAVALCCALSPVQAEAPPDAAMDEAQLKPAGTRYEVEVPATLDLAERARLSVHGLTSFLDPDAEYAPYGHAYFNADPPYLSDLPGGPPNWGKIADALVLTRTMCGSEENLDIETKMLRGMLHSSWMTVNPAAPTPVSVAMQALTTVYQVAPTAELRTLINRMAASHMEVARVQGNEAWYNDSPPDLKETALGVNGFWLPVFIQGRAMRSLTRWGVLSSQPDYVAFTGKLAQYLVEPRFWQGEAEPKVVVSADHGHFSGHHHSYTQALLGLLYYAEASSDARLKQFVRSSYEYMRNFGIARIGLFGEACTTGDMTELAVRLSLDGTGDYWDDVDQYTRNQLAELQITDPARLRAVVEQMPKNTRGKNDTTSGPYDPAKESHDNVIDRNVGVFLSDSTHPTCIPEHCLLYTICCTGNCTAAMYAAWSGIVQCEDGAAQVNLPLNRASPWLDVDSYLPYEGKVVVKNKSAKSLAIRMPGWVDLKAVRCTINEKPQAFHWLNRYLELSTLAPGDVVTVTFPVVQSQERYTLKWKQSEFWKESTNPGPNWQADPNPTVLTCIFRGNTLVDIAPREPGPGFPLYQRDNLKGDKTPMKKVTRYIAPVLPRW